MKNYFEIVDVYAREIIDSRGNPTVEAVVITDFESESASVPSGASTGSFEAVELRDKDKKRFNGLGVKKAVKNVNTIISDALVGMDVTNQILIDQKLIELDGTENKERLGASAASFFWRNAVNLSIVSMASSAVTAIPRKKNFIHCS